MIFFSSKGIFFLYINCFSVWIGSDYVEIIISLLIVSFFYLFERECMILNVDGYVTVQLNSFLFPGFHESQE